MGLLLAVTRKLPACNKDLIFNKFYFINFNFKNVKVKTFFHLYLKMKNEKQKITWNYHCIGVSAK